MASTTCPHCNRNSHLTHRWGFFTPVGLGDGGVLDVAYTCDNCRAVVSARIATKANGYLRREPAYASNHEHVVSIEEQFKGIDWQPPRFAAPEYRGVPENIEAAAREAHRSLGIKNVMAAVLMARSTLEAAAKDHGYTDRKAVLAAKIRKMQEDGHLTMLVRQMADEIRQWGNDMAHGDFEEEVAEEDALSLLALMDAVLEALYGHQATLSALQERRKQRQ